MMKRKKYQIHYKIVLCFCILLLIVTSNWNILNVEAASAQDNIKNKITSYVNGLNGSFTPNYLGKAFECCAFCNQVWANTLGFDFYNTSKITKTDYSWVSNSSLISVLNSNARPGDIIWGKSNHNMIIMGWNANGLYLTDGTSKGKVWHNNQFVSFSGNEWKSYYAGYFSAGYRIYHIKDSVYNSFATSETPKDTTPPVISNVKVSDLNKDGYTVTCTVTDNIGVSDVKFPTWTDNNGQDDLKWYSPSSKSGNSTSQNITFYVKASNHNNEEGWYNTHIYAYDASGNCGSTAISKQYIDKTAPVISNVTVSNVGITGYTVTCTVKDNRSVNRVQFPTWTDNNGQDDIYSDWWTGAGAKGTASGSTYTFKVNRSEHNSELQGYITHIYAFDSAGNYSSAAVSGTVNLLGKATDLGNEFDAYIKNVSAGTYLTNDNTNVSARYYTGNNNQLWTFRKLSDASYTIISKSDNKCLDVHGALSSDGTNVQVYDSNSTSAQKWYIYQDGTGYVWIVPACNGNRAVLDLDGAGTKDGTNVQIWATSSKPNMTWQITKASEQSDEKKEPNNNDSSDNKNDADDYDWDKDQDHDYDQDDIIDTNDKGYASSRIIEDKNNTAKYKILKSEGKTEAVYIAPKNKSITTVIIPETITLENGTTYKVTSIEDNAFNGCKKLKSVTIGKNITQIGKKAFYKCKSLKKIIIPCNVRSIGKYAFYGCTKCKTLKINTTMLTNNTVGKNAFGKIPKSVLITVPKSLHKEYKTLLISKGINKKSKIKSSKYN